MYVKLALGNAKKSIKDYLIYFITITICVSFFYAITSLSSSSYEFITEESYNFETLKVILKYATYLITGILILLVSYVNKYMVKRRQREFATYILLGAEQKNVALIFFVETLIIGFAAIIAGIFVGTLFSQAITAIVLLSAQQKIVFSFKLYMDTVKITFIFFLVMFCIIGLYDVVILRKIKLIDMLNSHKQVEFQFKRSGRVYGIVFALAVILYSISGFCTFKMINSEMDYSLKSLMFIGVALILFIIATYALFYSIGYILIYIKNKRINFKYEGTNLFLIGSIVSKIKTAPILMATIAMTFLGAMISFIITLVMSQWSLGYLDMRVPYDVEIRNFCSMGYGEYRIFEDIKDIPRLDYSGVVDYLNEKGLSVKDYCQVEKYFIDDQEFSTGNMSNIPTMAISLSDFNKLRDMLGYKEISLSEDEFAIQMHRINTEEQINRYISAHQQFNIGGKTYNISEGSYYKESLGEGIFNRYADKILILPDEACKNLTLGETNFTANINKKMSCDAAIDFETTYVEKWFTDNNGELLRKYSDNPYILDQIITTRIKSLETNNILNITLSMRILGIYLGVVLLMISLTILSLSQLTDSIDHKDRFNVLKKLGVEDKEINTIVLKQVSVYFVIPVAIAMVGVIAFVYNYYFIHKDIISAYIGDATFVFSIIAGVLLMIGIYICYFTGTYYTFKRNIKN